jgi:hypothetical protein
MGNLIILNKAGKPIVLNAMDQMQAQYIERHLKNDLGYEVPITTLTTIIKKVTEQKFFEIPPADYLPVRVGEGSWSSNLMTYRSFAEGDQFETGVLNLGTNTTRLASADAAVDGVSIKVYNWGKSIAWNIMELQVAAKAGNWDLVTAKEKARKKNWDLGIQRVAFLGARGSNATGGDCLGLLNQAGITNNTTVITKAISSMSTAELKAFQFAILEAYRANCERTAWPTHLIIPETDYNGMTSQSSPDFPIKSVLEVLEEALKASTRNKNFKILPLAYGDAAYHADIATLAGKQVYVLLNYEEESLRMDIPVDYTTTVPNSLDNFNLQNVGYGQFTGVLAYRPKEMMYFTY